jgi:hypothetical protein
MRDFWFVCHDVKDGIVTPPIDIDYIDKKGGSLAIHIREKELFNDTSYSEVRKNIYKLVNGVMTLHLYNDNSEVEYVDLYRGVTCDCFGFAGDSLLEEQLQLLVDGKAGYIRPVNKVKTEATIKTINFKYTERIRYGYE